ncbi:hypothetical protein [Paludibacterium paludis]|uniref:hypothetical protein n=1 Tax=Paludibacterium paludis TaxID=1225769 RepID=UPI001C04114C|nr:hypothetical protein [Paludibacterium paludis]
MKKQVGVVVLASAASYGVASTVTWYLPAISGPVLTGILASVTLLCWRYRHV